MLGQVSNKAGRLPNKPFPADFAGSTGSSPTSYPPILIFRNPQGLCTYLGISLFLICKRLAINVEFLGPLFNFPVELKPQFCQQPD